MFKGTKKITFSDRVEQNIGTVKPNKKFTVVVFKNQKKKVELLQLKH